MCINKKWKKIEMRKHDDWYDKGICNRILKRKQLEGDEPVPDIRHLQQRMSQQKGHGVAGHRPRQFWCHGQRHTQGDLKRTAYNNDLPDLKLNTQKFSDRPVRESSRSSPV